MHAGQILDAADIGHQAAAGFETLVNALDEMPNLAPAAAKENRVGVRQVRQRFGARPKTGVSEATRNLAAFAWIN